MSVPVIIAFVVALLVELVLPFLAAFWTESRLDVPWRPFWYGMLAYGLAQFAIRYPLLNLAGSKLAPTETAGVGPTLAWLLLVAGSTALVELGGRYFGFRFLLRDVGRTWQTAVMFGLGMAAIESLFPIGLQTLLTFINGLSLPSMSPESVGLTPEELAAIKAEFAALSYLTPLTAAVERIFSMALQVGLAVITFQAFVPKAVAATKPAGRGKSAERATPTGHAVAARWLWYALGLQLLIGLAVSVASTYSTVLAAELLLAVAAAGLYYWARRLRPAPPLSDKLRS